MQSTQTIITVSIYAHVGTTCMHAGMMSTWTTYRDIHTYISTIIFSYEWFTWGLLWLALINEQHKIYWITWLWFMWIVSRRPKHVAIFSYEWFMGLALEQHKIYWITDYSCELVQGNQNKQIFAQDCFKSLWIVYMLTYAWMAMVYGAWTISKGVVLSPCPCLEL